MPGRKLHQTPPQTTKWAAAGKTPPAPCSPETGRNSARQTSTLTLAPAIKTTRQNRQHLLRTELIHQRNIPLWNAIHIRITINRRLQARFPQQVQHRIRRPVGVVLRSPRFGIGKLVIRVETGNLVNALKLQRSEEHTSEPPVTS